MDSNILLTVLSLGGTAVGSLSGVLVANRLSNYRIGQLEIKVDKHNTVIERMYKVEDEIKRIEGKFDDKAAVANHRIKDLESKTDKLQEENV
jgi:hypothetical protein